MDTHVAVPPVHRLDAVEVLATRLSDGLQTIPRPERELYLAVLRHRPGDWRRGN
jgi:hypothetical protein